MSRRSDPSFSLAELFKLHTLRLQLGIYLKQRYFDAETVKALMQYTELHRRYRAYKKHFGSFENLT